MVHLADGLLALQHVWTTLNPGISVWLVSELLNCYPGGVNSTCISFKTELTDAKHESGGRGSNFHQEIVKDQMGICYWWQHIFPQQHQFPYQPLKGLQSSHVTASVWKRKSFPGTVFLPETNNGRSRPNSCELPRSGRMAVLSFIGPSGAKLWHGANMLMVSLP